jgi:hypothetical protein
MALIRHKKTGEMFETDKYNDYAFVITLSDDRVEFAYDTIAELTAEWEDYEPEVIEAEEVSDEEE